MFTSKISGRNDAIGHAVFETLEHRTLMSVVPLMTAPTHEVAAALHQPVVHAKAKTTVKAKTPAKTPVAPPPLVEPALTDPTMKYVSFGSDPLFSTAGPSVNDINQGDLGDCYFLSTLSAVAKVDPARIRSDVLADSNGDYTVDFYRNGKLDPITVDAELPVWPDGQLAYAGLGAQNCTWVAIVEKAFAEFRTNSESYAGLNGGWMDEAFAAFDVKSTDYFYAKNSTALMTVLEADIKSGQATTIGINNVPAGAPLIGDHAYEVDSVNLNAKGQPISVVLRNPWGIAGVGNQPNGSPYVTVTALQLFEAFDGVVSAHA